MSEEGTSLKINSTKPGRISGSFERISRPWKSVWVPFLALGRFSIIIPRRDHSSRQLGQIFVCLIVSIFAFIRFMKKLAILFNNSLMRNVKRASMQQTFFIRSSTRRINLFSHFQISTIPLPPPIFSLFLFSPLRAGSLGLQQYRLHKSHYNGEMDQPESPRPTQREPVRACIAF